MERQSLNEAIEIQSKKCINADERFDKIFYQIKEKFESMGYTVSIKPYVYCTIIIEKHSSIPIKLEIQARIPSNEIYSGDIIIRNNGYRCTENYLEYIEKILNKIDSSINTYIKFINNIVSELQEREEYQLDTLINNNGTLYIKNYNNSKIIYINPLNKDWVNNINKDYIELIVSSLDPYIINLMNIYIPAANISDTVDALLFFL